ncbi:MAG TPA: iron-containing redox enzyme family protein [Acidimicrobiia bacterium]|nr:iron-containing redox enzyme family protein [Acidimicrobiia bacterium]
MLRGALHDRIRSAMFEPDALDHRSAMATLLDVHALHLAPVTELHGAENWQHDPRVSALKAKLEVRLRNRLDEPLNDVDDAADAMRRLAHEEAVPAIYDWVAEEASVDELVEFVSFEGGPDADFDDLVAVCQIGLTGLPKLTLGANYWDEMGGGRLDRVHTELHRMMVEALGVRSIPVEELPETALERKALNGYLATNRALQPELLGSLGLLECQAGPRCRRVVAAMQRLGVPTAALPFYEEHAIADPRHGKDWIENAVSPLAQRFPDWAPRMVTGARWRATVNRRFFDAMERHFGLVERAA